MVAETSKPIIADCRISNNPALRSSAAIAELRNLQDELLLRWQVKSTEEFLAPGHKITKEEIQDYADTDSAREFASKALDAYNLELACCEKKRGFGIRDLVTYSNQGNKHPYCYSHHIPLISFLP